MQVSRKLFEKEYYYTYICGNIPGWFASPNALICMLMEHNSDAILNFAIFDTL